MSAFGLAAGGARVACLDLAPQAVSAGLIGITADISLDASVVEGITEAADTSWVTRLLAAADDPIAERAALEARQPRGRLVSVEEVADAVAYLASPRAGSTTGTALAVDGGMAELRLRSPAVRTNRVGRTGLEVTELGFGAAPIGNLFSAVSDQLAEETIEAAWQAGVRYFDTAPHYGLGLSERRLGAVLADHPRSEFVVSTKVGRELVPNATPTGSDLEIGGFDVPDDLRRVLDFSRDGVLRSLEASLIRLGLDSIDIVLVHDPDDFVDQTITEAIPALVDLREQGVVGAVGVGMNQWQAPMRIARETDLDVVMLAGRWTLLDRSGLPLLDQCEAQGVAVLTAGPFNSGILAQAWPADDSSFEYGRASSEQVTRARALAHLSTDFGATLPQVALQYPLRHPAVASVVAGMRSADEAAANAGWLETTVDAALWPAIDSAAGSLR